MASEGLDVSVAHEPCEPLCVERHQGAELVELVLGEVFFGVEEQEHFEVGQFYFVSLAEEVSDHAPMLQVIFFLI